MTATWNALIAALLLLSFATACGDDPRHNPAGPSNDSILGYDLALAPLHFVDATGHVYELLLALGPNGAVAAACYVVDGALFASIVARSPGQDTDVQLYESNRASFRAVVSPGAPVAPGEAWLAFAAAAAETRAALTAWQSSAGGTALARLHAALGRLIAASAALVPVPPKEG